MGFLSVGNLPYVMDSVGEYVGNEAAEAARFRPTGILLVCKSHPEW